MHTCERLYYVYILLFWNETHHLCVERICQKVSMRYLWIKENRFFRFIIFDKLHSALFVTFSHFPFELFRGICTEWWILKKPLHTHVFVCDVDMCDCLQRHGFTKDVTFPNILLDAVFVDLFMCTKIHFPKFWFRWAVHFKNYVFLDMSSFVSVFSMFSEHLCRQYVRQVPQLWQILCITREIIKLKTEHI